ncbi:MAG: bifunctional hydroxymethylpyrimidine kinase/phosphomethylpyrimidine kinase [Promethearchaeota archaeon]
MDFALTIAGADPSSGAGIQADIRTFDRCGVHPFSVITAITYQSATDFYGYKSLSDELDKQLDSVLRNYPVKYIKIGMIPDVKGLEIIVHFIQKYDLIAVLDPISISSAGERLSSEDIEHEIEKNLFPMIKILTPNISEASFYSNVDLKGIRMENIDKLKEAASIILNKMYGKNYDEEKAVIIKSGGEDGDKIFDLILINKKIDEGYSKLFKISEKRKIDIKGNIHGTGCVFSSAITAYLSKGKEIEESISLAEKFFNERFQDFIELPDKGKVLNLTFSKQKIEVINQIKEIYNYISENKKFSEIIPEVRLNISGSLPNAKDKSEIAGIEGRITIINGYPKASGDIKFGVSDHTARLILTAKEFDNSINFVMNLKYSALLIQKIQEKTDLTTYEFIRETQPDEIKKKEHSTMQWLIREYISKIGIKEIPAIIWDTGAKGKEPMIRLFGKNSKDMIKKLQKIIDLI